MSFEYVNVEDGCIPVWRQGRGRPLLLLHGWAMDHRMWGPQLEGLSDRFSVLAPDRRGFGENRCRPGLARELADIDAILDYFGAAEAVLLGMSQGGRLALRYAAARPERLAALILHGAPLDGFNPPPRGQDAIPVNEYRSLAQAGNINAVRMAWRRHKLMELPPERLDLDELVNAMLQCYRGDDLLVSCSEQQQPTIITRLAEIAVPTLVLIGEHDIAWLQLVADALVYGLANAQKHLTAGGGHLVNLTDPENYNKAVRSFLQGL